MKYIMMLLLLFTVGCTKNINIDNIQNINYKNVAFLDYDYKSIIDNVNGKYSKTNKIDDNNSTITIVDKYNINTFYITKNKIYTVYDNDIYHKENNDLLSILDSKYLEYTNTNFFTITYNTTYTKSDSLNIKLDNTDNNYNLELKDTIYNLNIYDNSNDELLYSIDNIDNNSINIRTNKDIKITFENKYNFIFSITRENDEFITKTKQK